MQIKKTTGDIVLWQCESCDTNYFEYIHSNVDEFDIVVGGNICGEKKILLLTMELDEWAAFNDEKKKKFPLSLMGNMKAIIASYI